MTHYRLLFLLSTAFIVKFMAAAEQPSEPADSLSKTLNEVVVSAQGANTRLGGHILVSTIAGTALQNLGTAYDVLSQLPMLKVDDQTVTVVGKGVPEIYIDGRRMRDSEELTRLQSKNMAKVEVDMVPGAEYSSDINAVVRITTRHDFIDGLSLVDRVEGKVRRKFSINDMLDLNYRSGKWDVFATGVVARNNSCIKGATVNTFYDGDAACEIGSTQNKRYPATTWSVKGGLNYSDGAQSAGGYYRSNSESADYTNNGTEWMNMETPLHRNIFQSITADSHSVSAYYDNTFAKKYHFHFDGDFRYSTSSGCVDTKYPSNVYADVSSSDSKYSRLWAGKVYMTCPMAKGHITIGMQDSYTSTDLNFRMHNAEVGEYIPSSLTQIRQTSMASYMTWKRQIGKIGLNVGVRYEYVDYMFCVDKVVDPDISRRKHLFTPDVVLDYMLNEQSQISLSYKAATLKPPYAQLTGSLNYVGMHEIEGGNPALRDERMHDIQLFGMWKGLILQADYTRSIDSYAFVKKQFHTPSSSTQLLLQPVNIDVSALSLYLVWSKTVRRWTPSLTLGMYRQWLELADTSYNLPLFSYQFENTLSLPRGYMITLNASGQSKGDMHTNRFGAAWCTMNIAVSKSLMNKAVQLRLAATDIFNTANNDWSMNTYGVTVNKYQSYDRRGISLSVTYRFQPRQSKYKGAAASEAEIQRL